MAKNVLLTLAANTASFEASMGRASKSIKGVQDSLSLIKPATLVYLGQQALQTGRQLMEFAEMGAKVKSVEDSFASMGKVTGIAIDGLVSDLKRATNETIDDSDLMRKATRLMSEGFGGEEIRTVAETSRLAARLMGTDVSEAYNQIADSVVNLRERGLKQAGIVIDLDEAYRKHAKTLGVTKDELSDYGKQMALVNALKEKNSELTKQLNIAQETEYERLQKINAQMKEFKDDVGKGALSIWEGLLIVWDKLAEKGRMVGDAIEKASAKIRGIVKPVAEYDLYGGTPFATANKSPNTKSEIKAIDYEKYYKSQKEYYDSLSKNAEVLNRVAYGEMTNNALVQEEIDLYEERKKGLEELNKTIQEYIILNHDRAPTDEERIKISQQIVESEEKEWAALKKHADLVIQFKEQTDKVKSSTEQTLSDLGKGFGDELVSNMTMLMSSTDKWADKFKKAGTSILQTIAQIIIKTTLMNALFGNAKGEYQSGSGLIGGIGKLLGGLLGGGGGAGNYGSWGWGGSMGGDYSSFQHGTSYVPKTGLAMLHEGEAVVPASENKGGGGGNTFVYIQAIDTRSFDDAIRRNPSSIINVVKKNINQGGELRTAVRNS